MSSLLTILLLVLGNIKTVIGDCDDSETYALHHDYFIDWDEYLDRAIAKSPLNCRPHHFCPDENFDIACGYGFYTPSGGGSTFSSCLPCDTKYYCFKGKAYCEAGYYCRIGGNPMEPPPGYYNKVAALESIQCPDGTYQPHIQHIQWHRRGVRECKKCPGPMFCPRGVSRPAGYCQDGFKCLYIPYHGFVYSKCSLGNYCINGKQKPCDKGYRQSSQKNPLCVICPEGKYCGSKGQQYYQDCAVVGWYCERGSTEPRQNMCQKGHLCYLGKRTPCGKGYYQPYSGQSTCGECPVGKYCSEIGSEQPTGDCNPGCCTEMAQIHPASCPPASPSNCNRGSYFDLNTNKCARCPKGFYCAIKGLYNPTGPCESGWYCEDEMSFTPTPLNNLCPAGNKCPNGYRVACSSWIRDVEPYKGYTQYLYQPERGKTSCIPCPDRLDCTQTGISNPSIFCDDGKWCVFGLILPCEIGHHCNGGGMRPCPNGYKAEATGASQCTRCADGEFCENGISKACPVNMICRNGVVEFCPPGGECSFETSSRTYTFNHCDDKMERYDVSQNRCVPCRDGRYCRKGTSFECFRYHPGVFCNSGDEFGFWNVSQPGTYYHLTYDSQDRNRVYEPRDCEAGTYQSKRHQPSCDLCPGGSFCTVGRAAPNGLCDPGYFCPEGSKSATENECPAGSYCLAGNEHPTPCAKGTFQSQTGQSSCLRCPVGLSCLKAGATESCEIDLVESGDFTITISCKPSCRHRMSSLTNLKFMAVCDECQDNVPTYEWSIRECSDNDIQTCNQCRDMVTFFNQSTAIDNTLVPHEDKPDWTYIAVVVKVRSAWDGKEGMAYHIWQYLEEVDIKCQISPASGEAMTTLFSTWCNDSESELLADIAYSCYVSYTYSEIGEAAIYISNATCNQTGFGLKAGDMTKSYQQHLQVVGKYHDHKLWDVPLVLQVNEPPEELTSAPTQSSTTEETVVACDMYAFESGDLTVTISCKPSCRHRMSSLTNLKFKAICDDCQDNVPTYEWSIRECSDNDIQTCKQCKEMVTFFTQSTADNTLVPHEDKPDWPYIAVVVKVILEDGREGMAYHIWQYLEEVNIECQIFPASGEAMTTLFSAWCNEPDLQLPANVTYSCHMSYAYSVTGESVIFIGDETCDHTGFELKAGDKTKSYRQHLQVVGKYFDHILWDVPLLLQVNLPPVFTESLFSAVNDLTSGLSQSSNTEETVEKLNQVQALISVMNEIKPEIDETDTNGNTEEENEKQTEELKKEKSEKISQVTTAIANVDTSNIETIVAATSTLNLVTLNKEDLSEDVKEQAFEIYNTFTEKFQEIEENSSDEDITKAAASLLYGVGSVLDITTDDYQAEDEKIEESLETGYTEVKVTKPPVSVEQKEENKQKVKEKTEKLLKSVGAITDIVFKRQDMDSEPAVFETPVLSIAVAKVSPKKLAAKPIQAEEEDGRSTTSLSLPEDLNFADTVKSVRIEFVLMKKNPYIWGQNSKDINPPVVSLVLKDADNQPLNIENSASPIRVNLAHDGGKVAGNLSILCTFQKINGTIEVVPDRERPCAATFDLTILQEKVTSFLLSIPANFSALLSIGLDSKFDVLSINETGFKYPDDLAIIRQYYGKLSDLEANIFDNDQIFCLACFETCCNKTENCFGFYENCMYYCNDVVKNNITKTCTKMMDLTVYCETCKTQCCNKTSNCSKMLENCVFLCSLSLEENLMAECENDLLDSYNDALNTSLLQYCSDCDDNCCSSSPKCTDMYSNCIYFCTNTIPDKKTLSCKREPKSAETVFLFPRESMLSENVTSYEMYFGLSVDVTNRRGIDYFIQLDPVCIGNVSAESCSVDLDMQVPLKVSTMGCEYWDTATEKWSTRGLQISTESYGDMLICTSSHLTAFSKTMLVAPTFIDPLDFALFATFFENPVVVTVVLVVWMLYFFLAYWARQKDKLDKENVGVIYCSDNVATDMYTYLVCIVTGWWNQSGTTANVYIYLKGEIDSSPRKCLKTPVRKCFQTGCDDWFLITTEHSLGDITSVTIWHDNMGSSPHWFVNQVFVKDIQMDSCWTFVFNDWLAVDRGKLLMTTTTLQPVTEEQMKLKRKFNFMVTSTQDLRDSHIWISIFSKSASNTFTRVQRLTCCLTLLLTTMLTNLMFYGIPTDDPEDQLVAGGFKLSLSQIVIGIESSIIMFPVNLLIVQLFSKVKEKPPEYEIPMPIEYYFEALYGTEWQAVMMDIKNKLMNLTNTRDPLGMEFFKKVPRPPEDTVLEAYATELAKSKDRKIFPWWFVYIAWIVSISTCLTASYFVALYGLKYGYTRSVEWLVSFFTGFVQSVFVQQPIKVLGIAFVLTLIFKKTAKFDDRVPNRRRDLDEEFLHSVSVKPPEAHQLVMEPLPKRILDEIKARLKIEWLMDVTIRDMIIHFFYLSVILTVVHGHRNITHAFRNTETVRALFVTPSEGFHMSEVTSVNEMYVYLQETVIPAMADITSDHDYATLGSNHYLVGTYRLRQLRIKHEKCEALMYGLPNDCKKPYWIGGASTGDYYHSWSDPLKDDVDDLVENDHWMYQTAWDLQTLPYPGTHATYSGGGYVLELPANVSLHPAIFSNLSSSMWIDGYTRAVFIEFTLYNPNVDLFTVVILLFELTNVGQIYPINHEFTSSLYHYSTDNQIAIAVCEVLFVLFNIVLFWCELKKVKHVGKSEYFSDIWSILELAQIGLSAALLGIFIKRLFVINDVLKDFIDSHGEYFVNFYSAIFWDFVFSYVSASLICLVTLMTIKHFRYNKRTRIVFATLGIVRSVFVGYALIFAVVTVAFAQVGYLLFGSYMVDYACFGDSWASIIIMLLGIGDFVGLQDSYRLIGPLFIVAVVMICQYILLAMMTTVLNVGRLQAKDKLLRKKNKMGLMKYIIGKMKLLKNKK